MATAVEPEPAPRRWRSRALVACAVLVAVIVSAGVVIHIETNRGELVIEVDDPDIEVKVVRGDAVLVDRTKGREFVLKAGEGEVIFYDPQTGAEAATKKFAIKRGDKEIVRATVAEVAATRPKPPQLADPPGPAALVAKQRAAVEWVLSVGGKVEVVERGGTWISDPKLLPTGPLTLYQVSLRGIKAVDDAAIDRLRELPPIGYLLDLSDTAITDAGVAKFVTFSCLANTTVIYLRRTAITRASLTHFKKLPRLNHLDLGECAWVDRAALAQLVAELRLQHIAVMGCRALGDAEMDLLAGNKDVLVLSLVLTEVTDIGIKKLEKLTQLEGLGVESEGVTDAALDTVVKFRQLRALHIGSGITDAGLAKIASLPKLSELYLDSNAGVTDAGLVHLAKCKSLTSLSLPRKKVTKAGIEKLTEALPNCRIVYDGGVIEPKK